VQRTSHTGHDPGSSTGVNRPTGRGHWRHAARPRFRLSRPWRHILLIAAAGALVASGVTVASSSAQRFINYRVAAPVTVQALGVDIETPRVGEVVTAGAKIVAERPQKFQYLVLVVRDQAGTNYDFPRAEGFTLGTEQKEFTAQRSFDKPGVYTYWVGFLRHGQWTNLSPRQTLTVGGATAGPATPPTASPKPSASPSTSPSPKPSPKPSSSSPSTPPPPPPAEPGEVRTPSNTGIPNGTDLSAYSGPCTIRTQGTVIDAKDIKCSPLRIETTGVKITRSRITGGLDSGRSDADGGATKVTVDRSEIIGNSTWRGIGDSNYVVRNSYIHGGFSGGYCHRNCVIEGNYIEGGGSHASGFRLLRNAEFRGNTLHCKRAIAETDGGCSSDLTMYQEFGIVKNVLVEANLFKATPGWFCARAGDAGGSNQPGNHTYVRFINNLFERGGGNCSEQSTGRPVNAFDGGREGNQWSGNKYVGGGEVPSR
jgi:hypothetical protein